MRILVLGSSGFVGRNLFEDLSNEFDVYGTWRSSGCRKRGVFFDYQDHSSWGNVMELKPDVIINAAGYGVVRAQQELHPMYDINYLLPASFFDYVSACSTSFFIQIGSAFEYDLSIGRLTESSPCRPRTHYGISKFMMSQYLLNSQFNRCAIIRPFGMFGPYEDESKLFPYLIAAQRDKKYVDLSSGTQVRDYFYVKDLSFFLGVLCKVIGSRVGLPKIINVGSNKAFSISELAEKLATTIPAFDLQFWRWGQIRSRENESPIFINDSQLSSKLGFKLTDHQTAFNHTVKHYFDGTDRE